jgi:hypothetical protein
VPLLWQVLTSEPLQRKDSTMTARMVQTRPAMKKRSWKLKRLSEVASPSSACSFWQVWTSLTTDNFWTPWSHTPCLIIFICHQQKLYNSLPRRTRSGWILTVGRRAEVSKNRNPHGRL